MARYSKTKKHQIGELSLLVNGLNFSSLDVGSIKDAIQKLDVRLEENTGSLQESWGQFVDVCNTISQDRNQNPSEWLNSRGAVDLLASSNITQTNACSYEPIALNCFLNNVIQALERNPGQEESIFDDLVQFASQQGIVMPFGLPQKDGVSEQEEVPLNTIVIENEQATDILWEAIRSKLRKGFWALLAKLPLFDEHSEIFCDERKINLLQDLCFLYPANEIWKGYKNYRRKLMDQYVRNEDLLQDIETDLIPHEGSIPGNVVSFVKLCKAAEIMIHEDAIILQEGIFPDKVPSFDYIYDSYLVKITQELQSVCESCSSNKKNEHASLSEVERPSGSRRGSSVLTVKQSDPKDNLLAYKYFFCAMVSLEQLIQRVTTQRLEMEGTVTRVGNLQNATKSPSSPVLGHRNPNRQSSKKGNHAGLYVAEGNLPLPFGSVTSKVDSQTHSISGSLSQSQSSQWSWRDEFKSHTSKISLSLSDSIKKSCEKALDDELQSYQVWKKIPSVKLRDDIVGGKQDYPRKIAKSCAVIMENADEVLPLASNHGGKLFHVVRSSFVDSLEACLKSYHSRLIQLLSDFPHLCSVDCLYIILSSAVFIRNHLVYYEDILGSEPRRPFPVLHRQFSELVDSVSDQIISYHETIILTVILQDTHSHNWTDHRPFFEDERCSFSVQMWNFHLQGLRHDLWTYCPPEKAQEIFTSVLHSSLVTLVTRYSRVTPSSRRVKQFRSDITTILLSTLSLLWFCCKSVSFLLDPQSSAAPFPAIHRLCSCLLTTLTVVSCPLETLCSYVIAEQPSNQELTNSAATWLSWLHPEVFKSHEGRLAALPDRQATFVLYKLAVNQPSPQWSLFLRALLSRNARLPVTIVKYGDLGNLKTPVNSSKTVEPVPSSWFDERVTTSEETAKKFNKGLVCSIYHILFHSSNDFPGLVNYLMAIVSREDSWKLFDSTSSGLKISDAKESPVWLDCVYRTFDPYIVRFLQPSLLLLCEQDKKVTKTYNFTSMSALPCGCPRKKSPKTRDNKNHTEVLYNALQDLLNQMTQHFCAIPKIMSQFLNKLQESVHQKSVDLSSETVGVKVLASLLYRWLSDIDRVVSVCDAQLSAETQRCMAMFAEIVWHVLVNLGRTEGGVRNPDLPSDMDALLISKRDWLNQKVGQIKTQIASQAFEEYQVETVYESVADLHFAHMVDALMKDKKGSASLRHAYNFIQANKDWLLNLVLVPGHILPPEPSRSRQGSKQSSGFNPLKQFAMIGQYAFNQEKIASFPFDWNKLLQSGLCSSTETVKRLVFNRSELQEGACLEDSEKELVNALKGHYGVTVGGGDGEQAG